MALPGATGGMAGDYRNRLHLRMVTWATDSTRLSESIQGASLAPLQRLDVFRSIGKGMVRQERLGDTSIQLGDTPNRSQSHGINANRKDQERQNLRTERR